MIAEQPAGLLQRMVQWAPIRIAGYAAGILATADVAGALVRLVPPSPSPWHEPLTALSNLLLPFAMCAVYVAMVHRIERRTASELDVRRGLAQFLIGAAIGLLLMSAVYLSLSGLGMARSSSGSGLEGLTVALASNFGVAIGEELVFRVVLFRIAEEATGTLAAVGVSAVVFGLLHFANPGATALSIALLTLEAGVMLALAYALTRSIWLAAGIHMMWNFAEGYIFGFRVSGISLPHSILRTSLAGPDLLTGGSFGPEGSIVSLLVTTLASALLLVLILRKREWRPARLQLRLTGP